MSKKEVCFILGISKQHRHEDEVERSRCYCCAFGQFLL